MIDEVARQPGEQPGMTGGVFGVHLIERHDEPAAVQAMPEPIDDRTSEELALTGFESGLDQFGADAEARRSRDLLRLLGLLEAVLLLLAFVLVRLAHAWVADLLAGQEHHGS